MTNYQFETEFSEQYGEKILPISIFEWSQPNQDHDSVVDYASYNRLMANREKIKRDYILEKFNNVTGTSRFYLAIRGEKIIVEFVYECNFHDVGVWKLSDWSKRQYPHLDKMDLVVIVYQDAKNNQI